MPGLSVLTYTMTVTNSGPNDAAGATVTDNFAAALGSVSWTCSASAGSSCSTTGSGNISDSVTILVGGTLTYSATGAVDPAATGTLSNTASVAVPGGVVDPNASNNSATDSDTLTPQADLAITQTDGQTTAVPGTSIAYTIIVTNSGPSDAPGTTVSDSFPAGLTGVTWSCVASLGSSCTASGIGDINDTIGLATGGTATYSVTATITSGAAGILSNTATVAAAIGVSDPTSANNSATDSDTLTPQADLSVTKDDGLLDAVPGTAVTYTITVRNNGPSDALGTTVTDVLPSALSGANWTCVASAGSTCTAAGSGPINETANLLAGGTATYSLTGTIAASATGTLSNTVSVGAAVGVTDPALSNNSATDIDTLTPQTDLSVTKTDSVDPVVAGSALTYTIVVTNAGPSDATAVTMVDTLPAGVTFVLSTPASPTCNESGGILTCNLGSMPHGTSRTVTVVVSVNTGTLGTITNNATVSGAEADPNSSNNSASEPTLVNVEADLALTLIDSPDPVIAGGDLTYTLTVNNIGPSDATSVVLSDTLPTGVTFVSSTPGSPTCGVAGSTVSCILGTLIAGANATVSIVVNVPGTITGGTVLNDTASVTAASTDPNTSNNTATADTTVVTQADVRVRITDAPDPVIAGGRLTYTVIATNNGPTDAPDVSLTSTLPAGVPVVAVTTTQGTCSQGSSAVTCALGPIALDGSATVRIALKADTTASSLSTTATVSSPAPDPDPTNNTATESTTITSPSQRYLFDITGAPRNLRAGVVTQVAYLLKLRNLGAAATTNVQILANLPAGVEFQESLPGPSFVNGNQVSYTIANLPAGASKQIVIRAELLPTTPGGTTLTATATVSDAQGNSAQGSFTGEVRAEAPPSLGKLTVGLTTVNRVPAGSKMTSTIDVNNTGRAEAKNVVITLDGPSSAVLFNAIPDVSSVQNSGGQTRWTWKIPSLRGPGKVRVKVTHTVADGVPSGTALTFTAHVSDDAGRSDSESATVAVR